MIGIWQLVISYNYYNLDLSRDSTGANSQCRQRGVPRATPRPVMARNKGPPQKRPRERGLDRNADELI
jgi:hypothetical protein